MTQLMQVNLDEGTWVLVDIAEHDAGVARAGRVGDVIQSSINSLEAALAPVCATAATAMRAFRAGLAMPDEIEIGFGVRLTAEAGAVIAKSGVDAHLDVTVRWARTPPEEDTATSSTPEIQPLPQVARFKPRLGVRLCRLINCLWGFAEWTSRPTVWSRCYPT
jgi:hypothetical protein